jgi:hypothetical protein
VESVIWEWGKLSKGTDFVKEFISFGPLCYVLITYFKETPVFV